MSLNELPLCAAGACDDIEVFHDAMMDELRSCGSATLVSCVAIMLTASKADRCEDEHVSF